MKYNKGFASIVILLVILGIVAVGGVAYYAGRSSISKSTVNDNSNYSPSTEQNYIPPTTNNPSVQTLPQATNKPQQQTAQPIVACTSNNAPSITIINPAAGASYMVGQKVSVTWTSCNVPPDTNLIVFIDGYESMNGWRKSVSISAGSFTWVVPNRPGNSANYSLGFNASGIAFAQSGMFTIQ